VKRFALLCALSLATGWTTPAHASPLNPWGAYVGKGVFAVTPFVYAYPDPSAQVYLYGQYGLTDNVELLAGVGGTVVPPASFDSVELMPRYFFSDSTALALHATWVPGEGDVKVAPEWHGVYAVGPVGLTVNAGWGPTVGASGFSPGAVFARVAPEWYFTEASSVFLEVAPSYELTASNDAFSLELVPGVSTAVADAHFLAFGVGIPVTGFDPAGMYLGAWYSYAFGGG
jgi:hypothetical protein